MARVYIGPVVGNEVMPKVLAYTAALFLVMYVASILHLGQHLMGTFFGLWSTGGLLWTWKFK